MLLCFRKIIYITAPVVTVTECIIRYCNMQQCFLTATGHWV
jgi:hypothetical protein